MWEGGECGSTIAKAKKPAVSNRKVGAFAENDNSNLLIDQKEQIKWCSARFNEYGFVFSNQLMVFSFI